MSTVYHTPIVNGESNDASTVNTRLADLDAGIVEVDDRVSTIIADGSSSAEVVDARNAYTVLDYRLDGLNLVTNMLYVDAAFVANTTAKRYTTISAAMSAASAGATIMVAPGTYTENVTISQHGIKLVGSGQPYYNGTNLIGGTIIIGGINTNLKVGITVRDLGVDIRTVSGIVDAIGIGAGTIPTMQYCTYENLTLIGKGSTSAPDFGHGIMCATGGGNKINNCNFYLWFHGIVVRTSYTTISNCYFYACVGNSIIIKSETDTGDAVHNTVTNIVCDGNPASGFTRAGPIRLQAAALAYVTKFNTVSNVTFDNSGEAAIMVECVPGGTAVLGNNTHNIISNVVCYNGGDHVSRAEFHLDEVADITLVNCQSNSRAAGYGFRVDSCARIRAIGCTIDSTGAGQLEGNAASLMYRDFGGGGGIQALVVDGMFMVDATDTGRLIDRYQVIVGKGSAAPTVTEDILWLTWGSVSGGFSGICVDMTLMSASGGHGTMYSRRIMIARAGVTTLTGSIDTIDTDFADAGGAQGTITITLDVATANTAKIKITGHATIPAEYTYSARIMTDTAATWYATNKAA